MKAYGTLYLWCQLFGVSFIMVLCGFSIIIFEILRHPEDKTVMSLIFAGRLEGDILMRNKIDEWTEKLPDRFSVHYILSDEEPKGWKYSTGLVRNTLFKKGLLGPSNNYYNLMCGTPHIFERGCIPALSALSHADDKIFSF